LQFWKVEYINKSRGVIERFAELYEANSRIIGVQLGVADGKYSQSNIPFNPLGFYSPPLGAYLFNKKINSQNP